jgi:EAL domain-containing protein (putative c-di-GMP-specific phosphodiesterase class I)
VPLTIEARFGVALHPTQAFDVETLLRSADAAMYQGKRGTAGVVLFDPALASSPSQHLNIQHDVRQALETGQMRLLYQPKVEMRTGRTSGVEALLRWQHPTRGLLLPGEFLPAVEGSGVIAPLTEWVLRQALADAAAWSRIGHDWVVAVNVSARNLDQPDFAETVVRLAAEAGVPPARLQIEVTETALPVDLGGAARTLAALAAAGFGTALDDFGVGYASLSHLRSLELTEVKIDRTFVAGIGVTPEDGEVVRSLIQLAHGLGLSVCAEGVETPATAGWLREAGCDRAQGHLFSRAVPWQSLPTEALPVDHLTRSLEVTP